MPLAIQTNELIKRFRRSTGYRDLVPGLSTRSEVHAVNGVDLTVQEGQLFGLLGPNGAGKTTLIKMLCTLMLPTSGTASIFGFDVVQQEQNVKKLIGLVTCEERSFYWRLTGRQNLIFFAALSGMSGHKARSRIDDLLDLMDLTADADRRFQDYSTGMKQKLAVARGLLNDPKLLFMDEPTRSLDPITARSLRRFIREEIVGAQGRTVLLTTHLMGDVEELCDRLAIMDRGRIVGSGTLSELRSRFQDHSRYELEVSGLGETGLHILQGLPGVLGCIETFRSNRTSILEISLADGALSGVLSEIISTGGEIRTCNLQESRLEDIFVHVVERTRAAPQIAGILR